jgi:hypothetical protein
VGHVVEGTHNVHGTVENANPAVVLPNRRHVTVTLFGSIDHDQHPEGPEMQVVRAWIDKFAREVKEAGIALEAGYVSFDRSNINLDRFYGKEDADRLRSLKSVYDPHNHFSLAYPYLAGGCGNGESRADGESRRSEELDSLVSTFVNNYR